MCGDGCVMDVSEEKGNFGITCNDGSFFPGFPNFESAFEYAQEKGLKEGDFFISLLKTPI